jgi:hypothetical protein
MAHGILIESLIEAENVDKLQRSFVATADVDGGGVVSLTAPTKQGDNVWTATVGYVEGKVQAIAYNPQNHFTEVNGKRYAGLSNDDRDYTNLANDVAGAFIPRKDDEIIVTVEDIVPSTLALAVAGNYLVPTEADFRWTATATAPQSGLSLKIEDAESFQFPPVKGAIGFTVQKAVKAYVVSE